MLALWMAAAIAQPPKAIEGKPLLVWEDYPGEAITAGSYGRVSMHLQINAAGRVSACAVTETSGSRPLDNAACFSAKGRGRFEPARDAGGHAVAGDYRTGAVFGLGEHQLLTVVPMSLDVKNLPPDYDQPAKIQVLFGADGRASQCDTRMSSGSAGADRLICAKVLHDLTIAPPKSGSRESAAAVRYYAVALIPSH